MVDGTAEMSDIYLANSAANGYKLLDFLKKPIHRSIRVVSGRLALIIAALCLIRKRLAIYGLY